jgi:hypothetical protein
MDFNLVKMKEKKQKRTNLMIIPVYLEVILPVRDFDFH